MKKFMWGYTAGVATAPAVYFIFRKPLAKHLLAPLAAFTLMDEDMDEVLFNLMSSRLDFQELKEKYGKQIQQMKAQGYSHARIADILDIHEKQVRLILLAMKDK